MSKGSRNFFSCFDDRDCPSLSTQQEQDGLSSSPVIPPPAAIITALLLIQFGPNAVGSKKSIFTFETNKSPPTTKYVLNSKKTIKLLGKCSIEKIMMNFAWLLRHSSYGE